jgi:hypothetical protein
VVSEHAHFSSEAAMLQNSPDEQLPWFLQAVPKNTNTQQQYRFRITLAEAFT